MLPFEPKLLQSFTVFDVHDPDELGDESRVSRRFPSYNNFNTYCLRDRGVRNERPNELLSRLAVRRDGALTVGYIQSRYGTDIGIVGEGSHRLILTFSLDGSIALPSGAGDAAVSAGTRGLVYHGRAGTRLLTSDRSTRVTVQIDEARLHRVLEALLGQSCPSFPRFETEVDWAAPAVAPVTRAVQHLITELADPVGLTSLAPALETFTDTLAHLVLLRLPHSDSERLQTPQSPALPRQLRRAEAFIEAHAAESMSLADIAAAAGCSVRSLQLAFRRFRGTTPLAALHDTRLRAARAAFKQSDAPPLLIAREFGFSSARRFRAAFRRRFGEEPPKTR